MPGLDVRADYDGLKSASLSFSRQSEAIDRSLRSLKGQMDVLQGGDWVGQGATAFFAEMNDQVLPVFQRLRSALQSGAEVTQKINQKMKTAEEEAARVLRGAGAAGALGGPGGAAATTAAGPTARGGAGGGAATTAAGPTAGGGAGGGAASLAGGTKAKEDPRVTAVQALIDKGDKDGAIAEAIKQYKIDVSTANGTPKRNASTKGEGDTSKDRTVSIGDKAFSSPGWLASSVGHEIVHTKQAADRWYTDPQGSAMNEIEAYDWEIKHAPENGLSDDEVATLNRRRKSYYNKLNADNQKIIDGGSYVLPKAP